MGGPPSSKSSRLSLSIGMVLHDDSYLVLVHSREIFWAVSTLAKVSLDHHQHRGDASVYRSLPKRVRKAWTNNLPICRTQAQCFLSFLSNSCTICSILEPSYNLIVLAHEIQSPYEYEQQALQACIVFNKGRPSVCCHFVFRATSFSCTFSRSIFTATGWSMSTRSNISLLASLLSTAAQEQPPSNSIMCLASIRPNAKLRYNGGSPSRFEYSSTVVHSMHLHSLGRRAQNSFACSMPRMSLSSNAKICLARMGEVQLNLSSSNQGELKHHEEEDLYGS